MLDDNANTLTHPLQLHANIDTWKKFTCNMFDPRCYKKVKCVCSYQPAKYLMEKSLTLFLPLYTYFDTIVSIFKSYYISKLVRGDQVKLGVHSNHEL